MINTAHFHPMLVHFPIAIITVGVFADICSLVFKKEKCLSTMGYYLEIAGMLAAIVAFTTGILFTAELSGEAGTMREKHALFAFITLITIVVATCFRVLIVILKKNETRLKYVSLGVFFLAFIFVSITGYLGGILVLDYLIGV